MSTGSPSSPARQPPSWSLVAVGLWMRTGIAGAGIALLAPALFAAGEASFPVAALWMAAGALVAWIGWHRTRTLLGDDAVPASERPARPVGAPARSIAH